LELTIKNIIQNDFAEISHLQPEGWSNILPYYNFYVNSNFCHAVKITQNNKILGVGAAIMHEHTAWLGHIIVHTDHRNKGLGKMITQSLIDFLYPKQIKTILLIATTLGEPVYRRLGFEKETEYINFKQEKNLTLLSEGMAFSKAYEKQILDLDQKVSGELRSRLLSPHLEHAKLIIENNCVHGFYLPTLGEGCIIAESEEAGIKLLGIKHTAPKKTAMPINNKAGCEFLLRNGFTEAFRGSRMWLGKKISSQPENNYSRIGGNLG
jgi:GNAT superfamily N-acetyltransferase